MKKAVSTVLAMAMFASVGAVSVSAASANQDSSDALSTEFTFEYKNDPTYTCLLYTSRCV